ncbi:hypothetical protein, partial [Pseudomonas cannabina]
MIAEHIYKPTDEKERKKAQWLMTWASSLKASPLNIYVRIGEAKVKASTLSDPAATYGVVWQVEGTLQVRMSAPGFTGLVCVSAPAAMATSLDEDEKSATSKNELSILLIEKYKSRLSVAYTLLDTIREALQ